MMNLSEQERAELLKFCRENLKFYIDTNALWVETNGAQGAEIKKINKIKEQYNLDDDKLLQELFDGNIIGIEKRA